jgi:uncharacterized protein involved in type VI secretion and phage assembly
MPQLNGVLPAIVIDNVDPLGQGRVQVRFDKRGDLWARVATLMAGRDRGTFFMPDIDDEVLVAFGESDRNRAFVIGSLWNDMNLPPETVQPGNNKKVVRSRNGLQITFNDENGRESLEIESPGGQKVTLQDGPGSLEISDSNGNSLRLEPSGITVTSSAKVHVQASTVTISCGMLTVDSGMSKFSGVVQCDTMISNSVVSASYTPGAGNVM